MEQYHCWFYKVQCPTGGLVLSQAKYVVIEHKSNIRFAVLGGPPQHALQTTNYRNIGTTKDWRETELGCVSKPDST